MKKAVLFLSFLVLSFTVKAQTKNISLPWQDNLKSISSMEKKKVSSEEKGDFYFNLNLSEGTPLYQKQWKDTGFADENSIAISNVSYGSLTATELSQLNKNNVSNKLTYSINTTKAREVIYTTVNISPVIKTNGIYQKVLSFDVSYRYKAQQRSLNSIAITNSVLATGNWYKFKVEKTGIYRISKSFLNDLGMNTNGINPRNLKIYGNGGKPLPLLNAENTVFDLPENAIQVIGEGDSSFDSEDFIIFYGESTLGYDAENDTNENPYSNESYYYVTADGGPGKRVQPMTQPTATATTTITQFNDYKFHEQNQISPAKVGRRWFGNRFDIEREQTYDFNFPNIVSGEPLKVTVKAASASETSTSIAVSVNSTSIDPITFGPIDDPTLLSTNGIVGLEMPASGETVTIDLQYSNGGNPSSIGYLDYILVEASRQLTGVDGQLAFQYNKAAILSGVGEYQIGNAAQFSQVWDITNPDFILAIQNETSAGSFSFKAALGEIRKYIAINPSDYYIPVKIAHSRVPNQNLKGTIFNDTSGNFQDIDYLIITAPFLVQPALRLASYHKNYNNLNVKVVTTDKIYEEFSSGKQDIGAIRNFVRYVYENASSPNKRVKYLCLFGDTSVDYKNRLPNNNNIVPTFHTLHSNSTFSSFMSDDYFGNMDINEGTIGFDNDGIPNNGSDIDKMDITVGRILTDEVQQANILVNKVIDYGTKVSYGNWRNNFVLISDDVDAFFEYGALEVTLDSIGDRISARKPFVNVKKIHTDAFKQQTAAGGNRYPRVNEEISNAIEVGALVVNYFGHGGEDGLAKEFIFTKPEAQSLKNKNKYPCIVTVTCEFTKFDNPQRITAGELTFWNKEGGAVSLITTTRSISVGLGVEFNKILARHLYGFDEVVPNAPAESLLNTKNEISNALRRVVFYIGDPAMHLAFPKQKIRLTSLNGIPISEATDTLKALSKVRIGGEVVNESGALLSDYNGILEAKVFDKTVIRQTLGNDGVRDNNSDADNDGDTNNLLLLNFKTLGEGLFNGQATIADGKFEFEFVIPRDIQIPVGNGRVSLYAQKNNELEDQTGVNLDLKIGGLNENAPEDNTGPLIQLFMNDESFVAGGITNNSPILIAKLEDENGLNTASGIGHDMIAILDGDESDPIVVNEYYQAEVDDYTRGITSYRLRDLEDGLHTLTFKAWDVYNNSSTADLQFIVAGSDKLKITRVLNYPNPFVNYTEFWFNHNRPFEPLEVQVQVFTVTGKVVWTTNQIVNTEGFLSREIVWDGRDDFGDRIGKGVYVYKITVKSTLTNKRVEKFEKLVIL